MSYISFFFFFQAEDGIRDYKVTGVQTCALPISTPRRNALVIGAGLAGAAICERLCARGWQVRLMEDRKSTRLNSSHLVISYAVFCLKKKNEHGQKLRSLPPRRLSACDPAAGRQP